MNRFLGLFLSPLLCVFACANTQNVTIDPATGIFNSSTNGTPRTAYHLGSGQTFYGDSGSTWDFTNATVILPTSLVLTGPYTFGPGNIWNGNAIGTAYGGIPAGGTTGQVMAKTSGSDYAVAWTNAGSGSVSSVAIAMPSGWSISGSPVTGSGTITLGYGTSVIPVINGGTGRSSYTTGDMLYANSSTTFLNISIGTNSVLSVTTGAPVWSATLPAAVQGNITALSTTGNFQVGSLGVGLAPTSTTNGSFWTKIITPHLDNTSGYQNGAQTFRWYKVFVGSNGVHIGGDGTSDNGVSVTASGSAGNENIILTPTGSGIVSLGGKTNVVGALTTTAGTTSGAGISGSIDGVAVSSGIIGESLPSTVLVGSAVSLTTGTTANVTSISLTSGFWRITGTVWFTQGAATTATRYIGLISPVSATLGATGGSNRADMTSQITSNGADGALVVGPRYVNVVGGTLTMYLEANSTFAVSTMAAYGTITAERFH